MISRSWEGEASSEPLENRFWPMAQTELRPPVAAHQKSGNNIDDHLGKQAKFDVFGFIKTPLSDLSSQK